jgi:TonB family protein
MSRYFRNTTLVTALRIIVASITYTVLVFFAGMEGALAHESPTCDLTIPMHAELIATRAEARMSTRADEAEAYVNWASAQAGYFQCLTNPGSRPPAAHYVIAMAYLNAISHFEHVSELVGANRHLGVDQNGTPVFAYTTAQVPGVLAELFADHNAPSDVRSRAHDAWMASCLDEADIVTCKSQLQLSVARSTPSGWPKGVLPDRDSTSTNHLHHHSTVVTVGTQSCPADAPPRTISAAQPETPAVAQQQGVTGRVTVEVTIDSRGKVVRTTVASSPSQLLNHAAIVAAAQSTFAPAIRSCRPISGTYDFLVDFKAESPGTSSVVAYMGVAFDDSTGAVVIAPVADGPADEAGLRNGDVLTLIDGTRVSSVDDAIRQITSFRPGTVVHVSVMRDGIQVNTKVTLSAHP